MKQGYNGLKYFCTIVAVWSRTAYSLDGGLSWKVMAGIFSVTAAIYGTYWDLVMDWGLLQFKSKNWLLRDKLLIPYRSVYFGAMVLNVLLRFAWLQTVLNFQVSFPHAQTLSAIVASLADYGTFSDQVGEWTFTQCCQVSRIQVCTSTFRLQCWLRQTWVPYCIRKKSIDRKLLIQEQTAKKENTTGMFSEVRFRRSLIVFSLIFYSFIVFS